MESKEGLSSSICSTCGKEVEILNDDLCFSMSLHMGTHKPLEVINQQIEQQRRKEQLLSKNMNAVNNNFCQEYQNNEKSLNNGLNYINKRTISSFIEAEQNSASSSGINKTSNKTSKDVIIPHPIHQPMSFSLLEQLFNSIKSQLHRGFFSENSDGIAFCKICNVTVQPMIKVIEHLKTRLHENNAIQYLINLLPVELHHIMEFVSFYCSSLYCRLCELKIDSCSTNPNEVIYSVTLHNLSKCHLENKASDQSDSTAKQALFVVKSLAKGNPIISSNQHLLDLKLKPEFMCKLCNKVIGQNLNEKELNRLFNEHFLSKPHLESFAYSELAEFENRLDIHGKERHNFILADCNVYCTMCEMFVEPKVETLISHVAQSLHGEQLHSVEVNMPTTSHMRTTDNQASVPKNVTRETNTIISLLNALPKQLRNTDCIVENDIGEILCLICNTTVPSNPKNLETHLLGNKHTKKKNKLIQTSENNLDIKTFLPSNKENNTIIQWVSKDEFYCNICNVSVPLLGQERHLKEVRHMNLVLAELSKTDEDIKHCIEHIAIINGYYTCKICKARIMNHNTQKYCKYFILNHMTTDEHMKYVEKRYALLLKKLKASEPQLNLEFLNITKRCKIRCTLCSSYIQGSLEEDIFKQNILSHLAEITHVESFNDSDVLKTKSSCSPVTKLFAGNFKDDVPYVKVTPSENLSLCTLCNCTVSSHCLSEHLEGKYHNQMKALRIESLSHVKTIERQNSMRNIGSLLLLLNNNN